MCGYLTILKNCSKAQQKTKLYTIFYIAIKLFSFYSVFGINHSLLGLDTNGHAHRPYSEQYLANILVVDKGLEKIEKMMSKFYGNDHNTAYVLAADHGMSNRGSHGDGDPQNTETPLVVWGAGINAPNTKTTNGKDGHDEISRAWKLGKWERNDVSQADVAPLMVLKS